MKSCQIVGMRLVVLYALVVMTSSVAWARSAALSLDFPLTPQEQAARLRNLANPEVALRLHPSGPGVVSRITAMPFYQRNYRGQWFEGPLDGRMNRRILLAERIGEQGRARFAAERGLIKLLGSGNKTIPQGPDSAYWNPGSGRIVVLEAKGGGSPVKPYFNSSQGTNLNAVRSAENVLTTYRRRASHAMKVQMARIILAAEKVHLDTGVIRTTHVLGKPNAPRLTDFDSTKVAREARSARQRMIREFPETREYFREAGRDHLRDRRAFRAGLRASGLKHRAVQGMRVIGFVGALGLGWEAYQQSRVAWSMFDDPTLNGGMLPYMQTGVAFGRAAQAVTAATFARGGVTEPRNISNLSAKGRAIRVVGRAFLPISLGVESLQLATAYYEYGLGRISQRELYLRSAGTVIFATFTTSGAAIGGIVGFSAGGVGAMPGAIAGAKVGAVVAIPAQFATDYLVNWYYREFDEQQLRTVNAVVETFYGLDP